MSTLYAMADIDVNNLTRVNQIDYAILFNAVVQYVNEATTAALNAVDVFVEEVTTEYKERYILPIGGEMDELVSGSEGTSITATGEWDVAYPLKEFQNGWVATRVNFAYMTPDAFQKHIDGIVGRYLTRVRKEILREMFNNTSFTFPDRIKGNLTIVPLANGDGVLYPPTPLNEDPQEETNHVISTYTTISTSDNPWSDFIRPYFSRRFGLSPNDVITFINSSDRAEVESMGSFRPIANPQEIQNTSQEYAINLPAIPGEVIGRSDSCVISVWDYVPADYILSVDTNAPAPSKMRVDPADTGLGGGNLVPLEGSNGKVSWNDWNARFGIGIGNRLNGFVVQLKAAGNYDVPSAYART